MHSNRFYFLHIPKTAGVSIHKLLEESAGPYLHLHHPHELQWSALLIWKNFRGCGGHHRWDDANRRGFLDGYTMTFLRNPIERVLSQYEFARMPDLGGRPDSLIARRAGLTDLLQSTEHCNGSFLNAQTFALSELQPGASSDEHLDSALKNLEKFSFVGVTEYLQEDSAELLRMLRGSVSRSVPHENKSSRHLRGDALDEEIKSLLANTQSLDSVLYARALELRAKRKSFSSEQDVSELTGWPPPQLHLGGMEARITRVDVKGIRAGYARPGEELEIRVQWICHTTVSGVDLGFRIEDVVGNYIAGTNSFLLSQSNLELAEGSSIGIFRFQLNLGAGRYRITAELHRGSVTISRLESATVFDIAPPLTPYREGMVDLVPKFACIESDRVREIHEPLAGLVMLVLDGAPLLDIRTYELNIPVRIHNGTNLILSSDYEVQLFASYHWISMDSDERIHDGLRTRLPNALWANEVISFRVKAALPSKRGRWRLQLRLVQEGIRWFEGPAFTTAIPHDLEIEYSEDGAVSLISH